MSLVQILVVWGLASVSPFSIAQELVLPGNNATPHQPPSWFVRMSKPEITGSPEIEEFVVAGISDRRTSYGKPIKVTPKFACNPHKNEQGVLVWQFCDM